MVIDRFNAVLEPIIRGDDYSIEVRVKTPDGTPVPIDGRALYMSLKTELDQTDEDAAFHKKVTLSGVDAEGGIGLVGLTATESGTLDPRVYWVDIQMSDNLGGNKTYLKGQVEVLADVTKTSGV